MWIASRVEREAKAKVTFPSTSVAKDEQMLNCDDQTDTE